MSSFYLNWLIGFFFHFSNFTFNLVFHSSECHWPAPFRPNPAYYFTFLFHPNPAYYFSFSAQTLRITFPSPPKPSVLLLLFHPNQAYYFSFPSQTQRISFPIPPKPSVFLFHFRPNRLFLSLPWNFLYHCLHVLMQFIQAYFSYSLNPILNSKHITEFGVALMLYNTLKT